MFLLTTGTYYLVYLNLFFCSSSGLCCPRNGFGQLAKRQLILLNTLQRLWLNMREVRLILIYLFQSINPIYHAGKF